MISEAVLSASLDIGRTPVHQALDRLMVDELYASEAAFAAHKANPRMPGLQARNAPLLTSRRVIPAHSLDVEPMDEGIQPEDLNAANDG